MALVSSAPVAENAAPVDAGSPQIAPAPPTTACAQLDAATAAAPATEPGGIMRAVVISDITQTWGDWEGGSQNTVLYPSGFYSYSHAHPLATSPKQNGHYAVTDRKLLQETFDGMAVASALARALKETNTGSHFVGTTTTTVSIGAERIVVGGLLPELPSRWVGAAEPAGLSKPGVVGHHVADLKVLHAKSYRSLDCISTFDHRQAMLLVTLLQNDKLAPDDLSQLRPFMEGASSRFNADFADVKASIGKLIAAAPSPLDTPGSAPTAPPGSLPPAPPIVEVRLGKTTSAPPVSDADRVVASLRARFRACYMRGTPADLKHGGKLNVRATLEPNGEVSGTAIVENQGFSAAIETCVKGVVNRTTFDAPGGTGATVDIPMLLVPGTTP